VVEGIPAVLMDLDKGAHEAMNHLIDLGHRDLAYVGGPTHSWTNKELRRAAAAAARRRGARLTYLGPFTPNHAGGSAASEALRGSGATGVLTFNDSVAIGLVEAVRRGGVDVPGQLSVIGVDDIPEAGYARLTTLATPTDEAGRAAIDILLQREPQGRAGRGRPIVPSTMAHRTLPTSLVVRESTGPPARRPVASTPR
jgi:LacI family transcriptional regulator